MPRRTQAERSEATRRALIEASLDLLVERGWAGITSVAVCDRAGLTRGAFVHHFDGLAELFAAALDHRYAELSAAAATGAGPTTIADLVGRTWESMTATNFKVVIEAWLAAANDAELGRAIGPVIERFAKLVHPERRSRLLADAAAQTFFFMAREAMLGLALGRATSGGRALDHEGRVLEQLAHSAREHDVRLAHPLRRPGDER
jgi:AcrR family transcriptional regulator